MKKLHDTELKKRILKEYERLIQGPSSSAKLLTKKEMSEFELGIKSLKILEKTKDLFIIESLDGGFVVYEIKKTTAAPVFFSDDYFIPKSKKDAAILKSFLKTKFGQKYLKKQIHGFLNKDETIVDSIEELVFLLLAEKGEL